MNNDGGGKRDNPLTLLIGKAEPDGNCFFQALLGILRYEPAPVRQHVLGDRDASERLVSTDVCTYASDTELRREFSRTLRKRISDLARTLDADPAKPSALPDPREYIRNLSYTEVMRHEERQPIVDHLFDDMDLEQRLQTLYEKIEFAGILGQVSPMYADVLEFQLAEHLLTQSGIKLICLEYDERQIELLVDRLRRSCAARFENNNDKKRVAVLLRVNDNHYHYMCFRDERNGRIMGSAETRWLARLVLAPSS